LNCKRKSRRRFFLVVRWRSPPVSSEFRGGGFEHPNPPHPFGTPLLKVCGFEKRTCLPGVPKRSEVKPKAFFVTSRWTRWARGSSDLQSFERALYTHQRTPEATLSLPASRFVTLRYIGRNERLHTRA